jgi:hypothetical protein
LKKRVFDMAGILAGKVKVSLNGNEIVIKKFKDYVDYYLKGTDDRLKIYDQAMKTDRWDILVTFSDG